MAALHTIRTTIQPYNEITVDHNQYEQLLEQGLVFDGTPPDPVADPLDARLAERLADDASTARQVIDGLVAGSITAYQDPFVAALVADASSETSMGVRAAAQGTAVAVLDEQRQAAAAVIDAVGEWWVYPTATYLTGPSRTFFGAVSATGAVLACSLDHETQKTQRVQVGTAIVDDHCRPALWVESGRRSVIAWNNHNADGVMHLRVGPRGGGITRWGPDQPVTFPSPVSYAQIHHVPELSTATTDTFWILFRALSGATWQWRIKKFVVDQITGIIDTSAPAQTVFDFGSNQGYVTSAPFINIAGHAAIRLALGYNPRTSTLHDIWYAELDLVTGAMTSPGTAVAASVSAPSGLPVTVSTLLHLVAPSNVSESTRLLAVRPGPLGPAVAYARWDTATLTATYHLAEQVTIGVGSGLRLANNKYATTPSKPALDQAGMRLRAHIAATDYTNATQTIARRYDGATNNRSWMWRINSTGALEFTWSTDGIATIVATSSAAIPAADGGAIWVEARLIPSNGTQRVVEFYTSTDGTTWTLLGAAQTGAITVGAGPVTAPITVGEATANSFKGLVSSFSYMSQDGSTVLASQDFTPGASGWAAGATTGATDTDAQGNIWTLAGGATVEGEGWVGSAFGDPGDPIGFDPESKYIGGMTFPDPCSERLVYVCRENAGTWTVERWWHDGTSWQSAVLDSSTTRKFARPECPLGGGPIEVLHTAFSHYGTTFDDYAGDVRGISA